MADKVIATDPLVAVGRVTQLGTLLTHRLDAALASLGVTNAEAELLAAVAGHCESLGLTPSQLGSQLFVTSGGITKRLDSLESRGLLRRSPNPNDRRSTTVSLTDEGHRIADLAYETVQATARTALEDLCPTDQHQLGTLLEQVFDRIVNDRQCQAALNPDEG